MILISEQLSLAGSGNFGKGNSLFQAEKAGPFRHQGKARLLNTCLFSHDQLGDEEDAAGELEPRELLEAPLQHCALAGHLRIGCDDQILCQQERAYQPGK